MDTATEKVYKCIQCEDTGIYNRRVKDGYNYIVKRTFCKCPVGRKLIFGK